MLDISKIKQYPAPTKEYHQEIFPKKQIVLHHTASGGNSKGDMDYLNNDNQGAVNVSFFIDRDGTIWQAFSSRFYAAHLGVPTSTFKKFNVNNTVLDLHRKSIGIELDNWGWLEQGGFTNGAGKFIAKDKNKFYSYTGEEIPQEKVIIYSGGFLGKKFYETYYTAQINALKDLLVYLCKTYGIDKTYNENMWEVSKDALSGKNGIWTHVSYRESGKWDCHPYPELIVMLKSLINS